MIIPDSLLWIIGLAVLGVVMYFYLRKREKKYSNIRTGFALGLLAAIAICFLITLPANSIVVIENDSDANPPYDHTEYNTYGHPTIKLFGGSSLSTKEIDLKVGKSYLFNCSRRGMLLYPVAYTNMSGLPSSFKKADEYKAQDPIYVKRGQHTEISKVPSYWCSNPPKSIEKSENILERIWHTIFGVVDVKWCIIPYTPKEEIEAIERAVNAATNKD